jgi:type 1 fimbria pilin
MRFYATAAALVAAVAALLAAPAFARPALSVNVSVTMTNSSCVLGYNSVSHRNTRVVFHIINNGSVSHGFDISAKFKSGLVKPHQESTLVANFGRPGAYRYACVAAHSTVKRGVFTIRKT